MPIHRATLDGHLIAESDRTVTVEGHHYFPIEDVVAGTIERSWMRSLCFWKGVASYYTVTVGERVAPHAAWTYRHPSPLARRIKGHVAFWPGDIHVEKVP